MIQDQIEKHSTAQSIILHLLPGILVGAFYFLALQPVAKMGYPSFFALLLAFAIILVPLELGFLLFQGKKKTGRFTLRGIISYQKSIPWWQYLVWVSIIFVIVGAIMTLFKPVDSFLHKALFFWMPDMDLGLDGLYSKTILIVTYSMALLINVFLAPMVEELYFRGYLLPRMKGKYADIIPQLSVCGYSCLYSLDDYRKNHWLFANNHWNNKEEYLRWHDCSHVM